MTLQVGFAVRWFHMCETSGTELGYCNSRTFSSLDDQVLVHDLPCN
jgi:hypothetical protein